MVTPGRPRSCPSSLSVWAEMLTLVATRRTPVKMAVAPVYPHVQASPQPPRKGKATPPTATSVAVRAERRMSSKFVSSPAMNISKITPISAISLMLGVSSSHPNKVGPKRTPASSCPSTDGWPRYRLMCPAIKTLMIITNDCQRNDNGYSALLILFMLLSGKTQTHNTPPSRGIVGTRRLRSSRTTGSSDGWPDALQAGICLCRRPRL